MEQTCRQCSAAFQITDEDLAFYEKVSPVFNGKKELLSPPTLCPQCRYQRRLTYRNERTLYHRKCDLTGRQMISMYPSGTPFPVYYVTDWLGDGWDPLTYGRPFDFSRPFFEQFQELTNTVPHYSLFTDPSNDENSEYTNCAADDKNCYLISQAEYNEDCFYSRGINRSRDCSDCLRISECDLCYEGINLFHCYNCQWYQNCNNCSDCLFSTDLQGCRNCFGCYGLVQKQYYIFNQKVTPEEWETKVKSLTLTHDVITQMQERSMAERLKVPHRYAQLVQCEDVTGDHVVQSRGCRDVFDSRNLEDCAYCNEISNDAKDCMDFCMWGINAQLLYECVGCGTNALNMLFCSHCWKDSSNLLYCQGCLHNVQDCFGCYGLRRARYCILNKQYTKEEYEELMPRIISHMRETGEWGEFFPPADSPHGYNETIAHDFFPLSKDAALQRGWHWREEDTFQTYLGPVTDIPDTIAATGDDIASAILRCEDTGKLYKMTKQELALYRKIGVPVPKKSPDRRHRLRVEKRNPPRLWDRLCMKCSKEIETTYAPDRPEIIYCEACYLATVY